LTTSSLVARVAIAAPLDGPLNYLVPPALAARAKVGVRLNVPLGRRQVTGYLLAVGPGPEQGLKAIDQVLDEEPLFPANLVPFYEWCADYYRHPLGEVIRTALPGGLNAGSKIPTEPSYSTTGQQAAPTGRRQREVLAWLLSHGPAPLSILRTHFPNPHDVLNRLVEGGFLLVSQQEKQRDPFLNWPIPADHLVPPTAAQEQALAAIVPALDSASFSPFLLHGVTGSGKTEVYLRAIAAALQRGRQALVLVPEIALTPQLVSRFRARFAAQGTQVAVLHSGLSDGERYQSWRAIARGRADIVIGARSAIFAPLQRPGIIVVDEEHESGYKQGEGFRYNARDLALLRGQMAQAVVLLGSATPAVTTWFRAEGGQTGYLPLPERVMSRPMPTVTLIDLAAERVKGSSISPPLAAALADNLAAGGQSLLLLNRRGFAPFLLCADCGATFRCPNCAITLTYYRQRRPLLRCHYCDYILPPPDLCPSCQGGNLAAEGAGTERLEEELATLLPGARLARMDRDTTSRKGAHQQLVEGMEQRRFDILLGTQMIAKGHDFPGVTLVGVINADATLNFPDFRSGERTFTLLAQVAGRAGRGEQPGHVLIQTYAPDHYALNCALTHDYQEFCRQELLLRQELHYPPFGHLINLLLSGNDPAAVDRAAQTLATALREVPSGGAEILGPAPCPLMRLRGKTRMQILLKSPTRPPLRRLLDILAPLRRRLPAGVQLAVDVDPQDML
jgi:primosomal protein N' (replication factor Y) (superfamily II helicase)